MPRLDKLVADRSTLGRREARVRVRQGRVQVQRAGEEPARVKDPGKAVPESASVFLDGLLLRVPPELALFHKPVGVVSTTSDPRGRPCLGDPDVAGDLLAMGLHPVGRLDADTDGLLPFSRHGAWTQHLLHPRHAVEKVYTATVEGALQADIEAALAAGVRTSEGVHTARLVELEPELARITLAVTEGRHRMVRRMLANLGHPVVSLRRLSFGAMDLGELPAGSWREASPQELQWLRGRSPG